MWFLHPVGCVWRSCALALGQKKEMDDFCAPPFGASQTCTQWDQAASAGRGVRGAGRLAMPRWSQHGPSAGPLSLPARGSARLRGTGSGLNPDIKSLPSYVKLQPTSS